MLTLILRRHPAVPVLLFGVLVAAAVGAEPNPRFKPTAQEEFVPADARLELVWDQGTFTEGPVVAPDGAVLFSDIGIIDNAAGRIMRFDPRAKSVTVVRQPSGQANGLAFDAHGRLLACEGANQGGRRVSITGHDRTVQTLADRWQGKRFNSPNDLAVDPQGGIYFTDPRYGGADPRDLDFEGIFRIDPNGNVQLATRDVQKPNGILVSRDGRTVYVADNSPATSGNQHLAAFSVRDDGTLDDKRILFDFGSGERGIDGMALDEQGNIFATAGDGEQSGVYVFDPTGVPLAFIAIPGTPTNCTFAFGNSSKTLYVTAAAGSRFGLYRIELPRISKPSAPTDNQGRNQLRPQGRVQPVNQIPPVQVLVPGFSVWQLPVEMTNLNNVAYRPDGKLVALAYNGDIFILSDTDGDNLEDHAAVYFRNEGSLRGPIGMALTPPGYPHGNGLFVASKGKLSLIVDTDEDDRADREIIVANGWQEIPQNVDAVGVALAADGSIYFALGTANFANGYLLDENGTSHYDLASERGTVLRVASDFSRREIVCTGVRFPVALAINRHGDLFSTDQEGATWLPNGNPFDELLHIQAGRHYGFPPRHPRHLPNVIDEPSVYNYGPQHQSTCGLKFNEPVNGGPAFGPRWWAGDALVCGESRGKLFRTKLAKTPAGYVAQNHLLARLNMLAVDACVSPHGDLVVCTHSGPPDWGTGPLGKGVIYKIRYTRPQIPQPLFAWSAGPDEVRIAFDRPLDAHQLKDLVRRTAIECGEYVQAGDRFETLQPPYAVVQMQLGAPRFDVPVFSARLSHDRTVVSLITAQHDQTVSYAVTLPDWTRDGPDETESGSLPYVPDIDLAYELTGVVVEWKSTAAGTSWSDWLPHLDLLVSRQLVQGSTHHDALWDQLTAPGELRLATQLDLTNMLRPAVQPGSSLDYTLPPEEVTVQFHASAPLTVTSSDHDAVITRVTDSEISMTVTANDDDRLIPIDLGLSASGARQVSLAVSYHTAEDARPRALPLRRMLVPWATRQSEVYKTGPLTPPELVDADWQRGQQVFFGEKAACSKCHQLRGQGGRIGPDLSNLVHRDPRSVLRDITQPSSAINPDFITYAVELADGRTLTGVTRTDGQHLVVADSQGHEKRVQASDVERMVPLPVSIMPQDLETMLDERSLRDLLYFLLTEHP